MIGECQINPYLLVADRKAREKEAITRLGTCWVTINTLGYLKHGGMEAWSKAAGKETDKIESVTPEELKNLLEKTEINVLDVRKISEFKAEHVADAKNVPLDYINSVMDQVDANKTYYTHCKGGYRSVIFNSILKARGRHNLIDVKGGIDAMIEAGITMTDYICPSTLK